VGVLGAGYFAQFHHDAWARLESDGVELRAVCDCDPKAAAATAARFAVPAVYASLEEMLEHETLDLLDIATPPPSHLPAIRAAAARGLPAICQKPFCGGLAEAEQAVALAEAAGVPLVVHENFRFQPWHHECRRLLAAGALGNVYQATFRLRPGDGQRPDAYLDRQPYFRQMPRFLVHETAIHVIDVFRALLGEPEAVYARLTRLNPVLAGEDAGLVLFDFPGGARAVFDGNRLADHRAQNRRLTLGEMLIEGSAACLRLDGDGRLFLRPQGSNDEAEHRYDWHDGGFGGDCVLALQRHVVAHLRGEGPLEIAARDYLANLRIEAAVYRSNELGRRLSLAKDAAP
jgi:predicted dehydrogenase